MSIDLISEIIKFNSLGFDKNDWVVSGGGVLYICGIRSTNDLDVQMRPEVFDKLKKSGKYKTTEITKGDITYTKVNISDVIEVYDNTELLTFYLKSFDDILDSSFPYKFYDRLTNLVEVNVTDLLTIRDWKKILGREKDIKDVDLINDYISLNRKIKRGKPSITADNMK
jgi:hypothetical protein